MRHCQRGPERSIIFGALMVAIGLVTLLGGIGVIFVRDLWSCWPLLLVAAGVMKGLRNSRPSSLFSASLLAAAGSVLLLRNLNILAFDFRMAWPLIIIGIGFAKLSEILDEPREMPSK